MPFNVLAHLPKHMQRTTQTVVESNTVHKRIMIVDDEPFNVNGIKVLVQCLTASIPGFKLDDQVDTANNGLQACEKFKEKIAKGFTYSMILMDCNMPKMDGYDACKEIKRYAATEGIECPDVVALTGHVEDKYIQRALDAGMSSYVKKPAKLEDLKYLFDKALL